MTTMTPGADDLERSTIRAVGWRLLPVLMLGYFASFLDRSNVGMAAPTMNGALHLTNAAYGFGTGLFFVGYAAAEVPSNLLLARFGARRWLARIMISWGIVSGLTAFAWNTWSYDVLRALLGLAEAGFFPGVALYLTWWFPARYGARILGVFYCSSVGSLVIGPVVSGLILRMDGLWGLSGWKWLFVLESMPALVIGVVTWLLLTERPQDAAWLPERQRLWLAARLDAERRERESIRRFTLGDLFGNYRIWLLTLAWFCHNISSYALVFFLPLIVHGLGGSRSLLGPLSALPYIFALGAMILCSQHSDRTGERPWHVAIPWVLCAAGLLACLWLGTGAPVATMAALCFAIAGSWALVPVFWSLSSTMLTGTAAAAGLALINGVGNLGGWAGPYLFGVVRDLSGSQTTALLVLAFPPLIAAAIVLALGHDRRLERPARDAEPARELC